MNIFKDIKKAKLPLGEYLVLGSGPMAARKIRDYKDIDILVTEKLYNELINRGWKTVEINGVNGKFEVLKNGEFEADKKLQIGDYKPDIEALIENAEMINEIPFMPLEELIKFKTALGREKDFKDIELINNYLKNMKKTGVIILTSTGLSSKKVYEKFKELVRFKNSKKAVIITTAAEGKEKNKYSKLAFDQLESLGLEVIDFYDFENDGPKKLTIYDIVYVCGGNTFKLMKFARGLEFDKEIKSLLERGGVYLGVSAGAIITGPSIKIAGEVNADANDVGLTDMKGFNFVDFLIFPHYSSEFENDVKNFELREKIEVKRLDNEGCILIEGDNDIQVI